MIRPGLSIEVRRGLEAAALADEASALITEGYPRPALEHDAETLRWHLSANVAGLESVAAVALGDGVPVGFAAAIPRMLQVDGDSAPAYIVSFVVVSAAWRKQGIAQSLYDSLLAVLSSLSEPILTYAVDQSPGMQALTSAYVRHGFTPRVFPPMHAWGAIRGRSPAIVGSAPPPSSVGRLGLDRQSAREHLDSAPHSVRLMAGAYVTRAWRLGDEGREPYLLLNILPDSAGSAAIAVAVAEAMTACPAHGRQLVVPHVDEVIEPAVRCAGLRRMPGAGYRSWLWVRDTDHLLFRSQHNGHPVT